MNPRILIPMMAAFVLVSFGAVAEDILHFTNGTHMAVNSYEIKGQMIHVRLSGDAKMAFPVDRVEKVTTAGKEILLRGSLDGRNVVAPGNLSDASKVRTSSRIARSGFTANRTSRGVNTGKAGSAADRAMEQLLGDNEGLREMAGVGRPWATSRNRAARQYTEVGDMSRFNNANGSTTPGTSKILKKTVIKQSPDSNGSPKPDVTSMDFHMDPTWHKLKIQKEMKKTGKQPDLSSSSNSKANTGSDK